MSAFIAITEKKKKSGPMICQQVSVHKSWFLAKRYELNLCLPRSVFFF